MLTGALFLFVSLFMSKWVALSLCPDKPWKTRTLIPLAVSFAPAVIGPFVLFEMYRLSVHLIYDTGSSMFSKLNSFQLEICLYLSCLLILDGVALLIARSATKYTLCALFVADFLVTLLALHISSFITT